MDKHTVARLRGRGKCCGAGAARIGQGAGARIPICAVARAREVLRRRGCVNWTGRGSADSKMRGCAGAGSAAAQGLRELDRARERGFQYARVRGCGKCYGASAGSAAAHL